MTQEEVLDYNRKCAEFLGYVNTIPTSDNYSIYDHARLFDSDWNWIHDVVDAIRKSGYLFEISGNSERCFANIIPVNTNVAIVKVGFSESILDQKEAVVEAINQFLIWYENNK